MRSLLDFFALNAVLALLLAVAVGVAGLLIRAPWFANRAWLIVMLKLVTPPLLAIPVLWWQAPPPENVTLPENVTPGDEPVGPLTPDEVEAILAELGSEPTAAELSEIEPTAVEAASPFPWETLLAGGLLGGSVLWWALIAVRIQRFRSTLARVGGARPAPEEVQVLGREVARSLRLRKMPQLEMVDADWSPMLWVLGIPRVIFPRKLWDALDAGQRRAVLAHEFAHYARKDHWVRRLELVVLGLYWWLPVAWLARQQLRRAEEACCDQLVIASLPDHASKYAEALVETAVYVSKPRLVPLASGGATNVRNLKRRLQMIFQPRFLSRTQKAAIGLFLTLGLLALPFGFVAGQDKTVPQGEDTAKSKSKPEKPEKPGKPEKPEKTEKATKPAKRPGEGDLFNPVPKSAKAENPFGGPVPAAAIQTLKDELELLQAQMESKVVGLRSAERNLKIAQEISENTAKLEKQGSISRAEVLQVAKDLIKAQTDVESRQAELAEHKVRIGQMARKLETAHEKPKGGSNLFKPEPSKPETTKPGKADPIKTPPPALTADLEKLSAARARAMQELDASAKALGDLASMTAKMAQQIEMLQRQLKDSQTQLDQIRDKQEEFTKLRILKQREAEMLSAELQKLKADLEKSKLKKEKPEAK